MVAGNFDYVQVGMPKKKKRTLSPDYPRDPQQVYGWLEAIGWQIVGKTGVRTVPELVAWARKNDFSISLPVDRLSFLLAVATLNGERLDGEMSEGELVDAFRHVSDAF
uniref:Chromosome partition protein MukF winged-helix domain-containing protein n=1 Tax=Anopheles coluzzii TaxID=1518534 RepID=A0A8W7P128_ANOCL